jgi:hypothetical protein
MRGQGPTRSLMSHPTGSSWRICLLLFLLALGLRLGYTALVWSGPLGNADSAAYEDLAAKIISSQAYQTNESAGPGGFPADLQRPPGYPAYLVAVNYQRESGLANNRHRTALVQCVTGAAFALLLAIFVSALSSPTIGGLSAGFFAADWVTIVHTPLAISETLYCVALGAAVLTYGLALSKQRGSLALVAGLLLGCAALVKPAAQVLLLAFLIGWIFWRPRRWAGLLFLVSYMACVLPWMARNEHKYGVFTLSTVGVANLYFYIGEGALHTYPLSDVGGAQITADVNRLDLEWRLRPLSAGERSRQMMHEASTIIVSRWPTVLKESSIGLLRTSLGTASVTAADSMRPHPGRASKLLLNTVPLAQICAIWLLAIYGSVVSGGLSRNLKVLLVASVLCELLPAAAPLGQSRFRIPAMPMLCVLAATGAAGLLTRYHALAPEEVPVSGC